MEFNLGMTYFTADQHFGHHNIIKYQNRPFENTQEMDEVLIWNWNNTVPTTGIIFILGDMFLCDKERAINILEQLNGTKYYILGNHDKMIPDLRKYFVWVKDKYELKIVDNGIKNSIILDHYSYRVWNKSHHGSWQLYGHSHGMLPDLPDQLAIDVGVDCHNYSPISYSRVKHLMSQKTWVSHIKPRSNSNG